MPRTATARFANNLTGGFNTAIGPYALSNSTREQ